MTRRPVFAVLLVVLALVAGCAKTAPGATGGVGSRDSGAGAQVPAGSAVAPLASEGSGSVLVPNLEYKTESGAKARLAGLGLKMKSTRVSSSATRGTVVAQKPSAGASAKPGSTVVVSISTGAGARAGADKPKAATGAQSSSAASDDAAARAFRDHASGVQLSGQGVVERVLADDNVGDRHQRFILRLASGQTLLVAHNIDIAPRLPGLQAGDSVLFFGVYEWGSEGGTIHWTHHDPSGKHVAGWLRYKGSTYR